MILREMLVEDLDQVMEIETALFSPPWTKEGFFTYLTRKDAMFLVVEEKEKIIAYCGLLMVLDEGDITNVAVHPNRQREGIGHFLMDSLIRLDMSEYMEKFSVSRLIGAPPGYVGYEEGGQLTEAVRRKPYSVVLFDEVEKAHPDVFNILLQVLDDGRLTDNKGRTVNFKNTIVIMTSNLGSQYIQQEFEKLNAQNRDTIISDTKQKVMEMLKKTIRPEFLNRIDETIMFLPLTKQEIAQVVTLQMNAVKKMLEPQGFTLNVTDAAIQYLADAGFDPEFGARPVKRAIQRLVLNDLSKKILAEEVSREKPIVIDANGAGLQFRN